MIFCFQGLKQAQNQFRDQNENKLKMQGLKVHFRLKTKDGIRISRVNGSYQALYTIYNHGSLAINFANISHLIVITPLFFLLPLCLFSPHYSLSILQLLLLQPFNLVPTTTKCILALVRKYFSSLKIQLQRRNMNFVTNNEKNYNIQRQKINFVAIVI